MLTTFPRSALSFHTYNTCSHNFTPKYSCEMQTSVHSATKNIKITSSKHNEDYIKQQHFAKRSTLLQDYLIQLANCSNVYSESGFKFG